MAHDAANLRAHKDGWRQVVYNSLIAVNCCVMFDKCFYSHKCSELWAVNDFRVVLLRIPNPQSNPRILPESVRVRIRIRESFAAVSDGFGSSVCESIFTYQVTAFKRRVWPPVPPCGRLNGCVAAAPPPAVWSVTSRISQLQIIIWSGRGGGVATAVQGGGAAGHGGDYVSLGSIPFIQCNIVRCVRRAAVGGVDRVMCVGGWA